MGSKNRFKLLLGSLIFLVFFISFTSAYQFQTTYNPFTGKLDFYASENYTGHNVTSDFFIGDGSLLSGVATTFLGLTDTPGSYNTNAGLCVKVNTGETGLEFGSCGTGGGGTGDITGVNGDIYITNGSNVGQVNLVFNETQFNNTADSRIALNPQGFLITVDNDTTIIKYQNISNLPTCSGNKRLYFDGTTLSCLEVNTFNATYTSKADYQFTNNNFNGSGDFNTTGLVMGVNQTMFDKLISNYNSWIINSVGNLVNYFTKTEVNNMISGNRTESEVSLRNDINSNFTDLDSRKLDKTDQRYNDTSQISSVNTTVNIESLGFTQGAHTVDTNRSDSEILSISSVYNETNFILNKNYQNSTQVNSSIIAKVTQAFIEALGFVTGAHTMDTISNETDLVNSVNTTVNIESLGFTQGAHTIDTDTNESTRFGNLVGTDCSSGNLVIGIQADGTVLCATDATGGGGNDGLFVNYTLTKTTGNITNGTLVGYNAADSLCANEISGSHMCQVNEIINSIRIKGVSNFTATFRVIEGAPGDLVDANDCDGLKKEIGTATGSIWVGNNINGGSGSLVSCNANRAIACCK